MICPTVNLDSIDTLLVLSFIFVKLLYLDKITAARNIWTSKCPNARETVILQELTESERYVPETHIYMTWCRFKFRKCLPGCPHSFQQMSPRFNDRYQVLTRFWFQPTENGYFVNIFKEPWIYKKLSIAHMFRRNIWDIESRRSHWHKQ